jgi:hypothetical protein
MSNNASDEMSKVRQLLWIRHGHKSLYGDDGEMQCAACMPNFDYKRGDILTVVSQALDVLNGEVFALSLNKILLEGELKIKIDENNKLKEIINAKIQS